MPSLHESRVPIQRLAVQMDAGQSLREEEDSRSAGTRETQNARFRCSRGVENGVPHGTIESSVAQQVAALRNVMFRALNAKSQATELL
ncbi:unnamed protein product [Phytophthora lilii]|uniref:Unnamed protein product n=1 Tax=Phytophthora lilii TaxID=2077276 RepID=A0A9W6TET4_9STRA|nr:unnamed protein product [Phytophthora lilii]